MYHQLLSVKIFKEASVQLRPEEEDEEVRIGGDNDISQEVRGGVT